MQLNSQLAELFLKQDELNARFGWSQKELMDLPEAERLERVRKFLGVLQVEVGESYLAAGGRWWKQEKDWKGYEHLREELIDCFHFLASAFLATGGTAEDFFEIYMKKNQFNHKRSDWKINDSVDMRV